MSDFYWFIYLNRLIGMVSLTYGVITHNLDAAVVGIGILVSLLVYTLVYKRM